MTFTGREREGGGSVNSNFQYQKEKRRRRKKGLKTMKSIKAQDSPVGGRFVHTKCGYQGSLKHHLCMNSSN